MLAGALGAMLKGTMDGKALPPKPSPPPVLEQRAPPPVKAAPPIRDAGLPIPSKSKPPVRREEAAAVAAAPPPQPDESAAGEGTTGDAKGAKDKPLMTKAKAAWGAPPPLRPGTRGKTADGSVPPPPKGIGARPKVSAVPIPREETPPPPLFDQWLACLKFVTGWNDQGSHTADEVRDALREHLTEEGICHTQSVTQLTATVVPLLLDLRRIDAAVVKNLKMEVLRGLKVVQVSILRIVTFELCREQDAKELLKVQRKKTKKKADGDKDGDAAEGAKLAGHTKPYLASDISSLAKVVQHFRFDRTFSQGLHQLILSIRRQKRAEGKPGTPAAATAKRKAAATAVGTEKSEKSEKLAPDGVRDAVSPALKRRKSMGATCAAAGDDEGAADGVEAATPPAPKRNRAN
mmetsp:Transcript_25326/g.67292  ORF Transcript_25326/g.67292 Transcript_25326/m.67292 type:complete len:405 (-) Transcript_25326:141-1355(-)